MPARRVPTAAMAATPSARQASTIRSAADAAAQLPPRQPQAECKLAGKAQDDTLRSWQLTLQVGLPGPIQGRPATPGVTKRYRGQSRDRIAMDAEIVVALLALIGMEVVLGIDNLVFIAILSNRLPEAQRRSARRIGLGLAVLLRFAMLAGTTWLLTLTRPLFEVMGLGISGKDLILLAGGLFLIGKATVEIHHRVDPDSQAESHAADARVASYWPTVVQILLLDMVFSVD